MLLWDLPSTSVNFLYICVTLGQLPSTFCASSGLPSASVKFLCDSGILHQLPSTFLAARRTSVYFRLLSEYPRDLPSICVKFPCFCRNFCKLPSTFHVSAKQYFNCHQLSVHPRELLSTFRASAGLTISGNLRQLPSTSHVSTRPFVSIPCVVKLSINFHQLCVFQRGLPSNFHETAGPSINFPQYSVCLR